VDTPTLYFFYMLTDPGMLRTSWTDPSYFSYVDLTAAEIARELQYYDLLDILSPNLKWEVPMPTLDILEKRFHTLIREIIDDDTFVSRQLRLPSLAVLLELEDPAMWFPIYEGGSRTWVKPLKSRVDMTLTCCL
jgi:hypothetical protein